MNDTLGASHRAHRPFFHELGHELIEISFETPSGFELLNRTIQQGQIAFAYSAGGYCADLKGVSSDGSELNFWEANRIPFLSLMGDSPVYFFDRHAAPSPWNACLYGHPEHLALRPRLKLSGTFCGALPPYPIDSVPKSEVNFRAKEGGKLLFLKNGNDPEKLVRAWRESLPMETFVVLADLASELSASVASDVGNDIDSLVTTSFATKGWDISEYLRLRAFFVAQLDDYLRRVKSTMIGNALLDMPIEVHGFNWEHVDFAGRRATYFHGGDYRKSKANIVEALGLIDMSPNTGLAPHDRPQRAFGLWTLCVTNEQRFFKESFANWSKFAYQFDPESIQQRVAEVLAHPRQFVELGIEVAEQFRRRYGTDGFAQYLIDSASHVRLACSPRPPGLQDYFVWPPVKLG